MVDLIPEGCISLRLAYKRFVRELWPGGSPLIDLRHEHLIRGAYPVIAETCRARHANIQTELFAELIEAFSSGTLDALVRQPGFAENSAIPADSWEGAFYPERVFLSTEIVYRHGGYWDGLVGRTPFVRRAQFEPWLAIQVERRADPRVKPSPANQALRDYLTGLALYGVVPPAEIESLAHQWGLPPFESDPAPELFDPFQRSHWTLCMAVSWIVWRTADDVREVMDDYRSKCWRWASCRRPVRDGSEWHEVAGEELIALHPLSITLLRIAEAEESDPPEATKKMSIRSARQALWERFGNGHIAATACNREGEVTIVAAHEWSYLELAGRRRGADYLVFSSKTLEKAYTDVTVARSAILDVWPVVPPSVPEPVQLQDPTPTKREGGKIAATRLAVAALYGAGIPLGLSVKGRLNALNDWLGDHGHDRVSASTVRRALDG